MDTLDRIEDTKADFEFTVSSGREPDFEEIWGRI